MGGKAAPCDTGAGAEAAVVYPTSGSATTTLSGLLKKTPTTAAAVDAPTGGIYAKQTACLKCFHL